MIRHSRRIAFFCAAFFFFAASLEAAGNDALRIENRGNTDILNILVTAEGKEFFLRLDLAPKDSEEIENPAMTASLRVDCGIYFVFFEKVPLKDAAALIFGEKDESSLGLVLKNGKSAQLQGTAEQLLAVPAAKPLRSLSDFSVGMKMTDARALLPSDAPRDDDDAVIAGLDFAGIPWAARLYPGKDNTLERIDLRRPLDFADIRRVVEFLLSKKYVPWQAEFPGMDVDFAEMPDKDPAFQQDFLNSSLDKFWKEKSGEATIMFAPKDSLPALANPDAPDSGAQLFTLFLRPQSNLLMLDVAAYSLMEAEAPPAP